MAPRSRIPDQQPLDFDSPIQDTVTHENARAVIGSLAMTPEEMAVAPRGAVSIDVPPSSVRDRLLTERDSAFARRSRAQYAPSHGMSRPRQRR